MENKIAVGDKASSSKTYTMADVKMFAELSGDINPVHLDAEFAKTTLFKKPIVHGIFVAGQISALIANELPGPGSIYLHQELNFLVPVYHDDTIECVVEVSGLKPEKNIIFLDTYALNQDNVKVIGGKAIIKLV